MHGVHVAVDETRYTGCCPTISDRSSLWFTAESENTGTLNPLLPILGSPRYENNHLAITVEPGITYRSRTRYSSPTTSFISRGCERRGTKKTKLRRGGAPVRRCDPPEHPELSASLQARPWWSTSPTLPYHLARGSSFFFTQRLADLPSLTSRPFSLTLPVKYQRYSTLNNFRISHSTLDNTNTYRHVHDWYRYS